jgi:hypothetical protein
MIFESKSGGESPMEFIRIEIDSLGQGKCACKYYNAQVNSEFQMERAQLDSIKTLFLTLHEANLDSILKEVVCADCDSTGITYLLDGERHSVTRYYSESREFDAVAVDFQKIYEGEKHLFQLRAIVNHDSLGYKPSLQKLAYLIRSDLVSGIPRLVPYLEVIAKDTSIVQSTRQEAANCLKVIPDTSQLK